LFVEDELLGGSQQPCNGRSLGSRVGEQRFVARMEAGLGESGTSLMDSVKEAADSFLVEAAKEGIWRVRGCGVSHAPSLFMAGQPHQRVKREI